MSFFIVLCLVFLGLQLGGVITWPWVFVFLPILILIFIYIVIYALVACTLLVQYLRHQ